MVRGQNRVRWFVGWKSAAGNHEFAFNRRILSHVFWQSENLKLISYLLAVNFCQINCHDHFLLESQRLVDFQTASESRKPKRPKFVLRNNRKPTTAQKCVLSLFHHPNVSPTMGEPANVRINKTDFAFKFETGDRL